MAAINLVEILEKNLKYYVKTNISHRKKLQKT